MRPEDIKHLRRLEAAATKGSWRPHPPERKKWIYAYGSDENFVPDEQWIANHVNDAAFVAAARNVMPEILNRLERLREALADLVGASEPEELRTMEAMIRLSPAPEADKAAMINAIHALLDGEE